MLTHMVTLTALDSVNPSLARAANLVRAANPPKGQDTAEI